MAGGVTTDAALSRAKRANWVERKRYVSVQASRRQWKKTKGLEMADKFAADCGVCIESRRVAGGLLMEPPAAVLGGA